MTYPTKDPVAGERPDWLERDSEASEDGWTPVAWGVGLALTVVVAILLGTAYFQQTKVSGDLREERDEAQAALAETQDELSDAQTTADEAKAELEDVTADLEDAEATVDRLRDTAVERNAACDELGVAIDAWNQWVYDLIGWAADVIGNPFADPGSVRSDALLARQTQVLDDVIDAREGCIGDQMGLVT
jgi:hypothetical protein